MSNTLLSWEDVEFEVYFEYSKGYITTLNDPADFPEVEIEGVYLQEEEIESTVNLMDLLDPSIIEYFESTILENYNENTANK